MLRSGLPSCFVRGMGSRRFASTVSAAAPLSLMSWSVDMSERAMHGVARRIPRSQRIPAIVDVILSTRPDVVCLQDSSPELSHAITATAGSSSSAPAVAAASADAATPGSSAAAYELVSAARNGNQGWLHSFVRKDSQWCGTALPHCAFCTIAIHPRGEQYTGSHGSVRVTNFDLAYRGKGIPTADDGSTNRNNNNGGGLNIGAFVMPKDRVHGDVDPHRKVAIRHMADVTRPHIAAGCTYMGSSESLHPALYNDAWAVSGADPDHEHTINTMPIFVEKSAAETVALPEAAMTNFFYYKEPKMYAGSRRPRSSGRSVDGGGSGDVVIWDPCVRHAVQLPSKQQAVAGSSPPPERTEDGARVFATTVAGRYQRTFLRKGRHPSDTLLKRYQYKSFVVLRPWVMVPLEDGCGEAVRVAPTEQAPTLMMLA